MIRGSFAIALLLLAGLPQSRATRTLDIYFIDVEGGASTLVVTPQGQSVLMDAGYAGFDDRDPIRVERVAKQEAGLTKLDYVLTSHFHVDHVGGLAGLAKRIEIGEFLDHGPTVETDTTAGPVLWQQYLALTGTRRRVVAPGAQLALGAGITLTIVTANGDVLSKPLNGGTANPSCSTFTAQPEDKGENARSLGYLLSAARFQFANLGDISWNVQHRLACPINLVGQVDLFQVTHHGVRDDVLPQQMWPMAPLVAVMNNGPAKGAGVAGVEHVKQSPGLVDLWSLHRLIANDAAHNAAEPLTANLGNTEGCEGHWIRARVQPDGSFTVTNSRNGVTRTYQAR